MKNSFILIVLVLIACTSAFAQETRKPQEPEFVGIYYKLNVATGSLVDLERQTAVTKIKVKALGFGGGEGLIEINGEKSPVRFKSDEELSFIVKFVALQADPYSQIQLFALKSQKGKRGLMVAKAGLMGINGKETANTNAVNFKIIKHGESSIKIVPDQQLLPGEYVLSSASSNSAFCFGVDPPSENSGTHKPQ